MAERIDDLIAILLDLDASISERDDAAMDLGGYDAALDVLLRVAASVDENPVVQASCGTSIAEIWKRLGRYNETLVATLSPSAQSEIKAAFA